MVVGIEVGELLFGFSFRICTMKLPCTQLPPTMTKAELLLLKLIHLFTREVLLVKKLEIEKTKTT